MPANHRLLTLDGLDFLSGNSRIPPFFEIPCNKRIKMAGRCRSNVAPGIAAAIDPKPGIRLSAPPSTPQSNMALPPHAGFLC
jgi:hypothetical protein